MKLLLFGDFHFESSPVSGGLHIEYLKPVAEDPAKTLIEPLKARYGEEKISLMVFLGDYGIGKDPETEKQAAFKRVAGFVKEVESECCEIFDDSSQLKNRIIFLDGNHDVSRGASGHQMFEEVFGEYLTPFTPKSSKGVRKHGAPVFVFDDLDMLFACISTTQNAGAHFSQIAFDQIEKSIDPLRDISKENYQEIIKQIKKLKSIDIGTVTTDTIQALKRCSRKEQRIKIVASHHPLIQMQHATASHFETVNGPLFFDSARAKGYTFFISGHLHEFYCADITSRGKLSALPDATLISVPTFINPSDNNVQFVELDIQENTYFCRLLAYNRIRDMFEEIDAASNEHRYHAEIQGEHILLDYEIQSLIERGKVIIQGASTERIQAVSYDCALGLSYKRYDAQQNTWPDKTVEMEVCQEGPAKIEINPGESVLIYTHEVFSVPSDMMLQASPRASWIRKGLSVDLSFFVEPGFEGPFCFPVTNKTKKPIEISAQESIMSVVFHRLSSSVSRNWSVRAPDSLKRRQNKQDK